MRRTFSALAALTVICVAPGVAPALEIINLRPAYGPHGATRKEGKTPKVMVGDFFYAEFDIDGLKVDEKTNKVAYDTVLEFFNSSDKRIFERKTPNETLLQFGGARIWAHFVLQVGDQMAPGKYKLRVAVIDRLAKKETSIVYPIEVVPMTFGFEQVESPALALPGPQQNAAVQFMVVGFTPDTKKLPNVDVTVRVLDANGKAVGLPMVTSFPRDLPAGAQSPPLFLPVVFPITMFNRQGNFTIELLAVDKNAKNAEVRLRLPITVLDIAAVTGGR